MKNKTPVFDYHTLRFMVGLIALSLPFMVTLRSGVELNSISGSYHTAARNLFVGELCIVGAFMTAYNGHSLWQSVLSKFAAAGAIITAVFPTACAGPELTVVVANHLQYCKQFEMSEAWHLFGATVLFGVLTIFCFLPFQAATKDGTVKQRRRSKVYYGCGSLMVLSMAAILSDRLLFDAPRLVYYAESIALLAFGIAWTVSGKYISFFTDQAELNRLFSYR